MIAWIRGTVIEADHARIVVEAGGVGYEIMIASSLAPVVIAGEEVGVHVRQVIREDGITLFGFLSSFDRQVFDLLTEVKGCGPKTALNVIGELGANSTVQAVVNQDSKSLCRASGVGLRLAERMFVELKDKMANLGLQNRIEVSRDRAAVKAQTRSNELLDALLALGYKRVEAEIAADEARGSSDAIEEQLRIALRNLQK